MQNAHWPSPVDQEKLKFLFFGIQPWSETLNLTAVCFQKIKNSTFLANAHFESHLKNTTNSVCREGDDKMLGQNWQRHLWTGPNTAKVKLDLKPHRHERSRLPCPGSMLRTCRGAKHFLKSQLYFQKLLKLGLPLNFSKFFMLAKGQ